MGKASRMGRGDGHRQREGEAGPVGREDWRGTLYSVELTFPPNLGQHGTQRTELTNEQREQHTFQPETSGGCANLQVLPRMQQPLRSLRHTDSDRSCSDIKR